MSTDGAMQRDDLQQYFRDNDKSFIVPDKYDVWFSKLKNNLQNESDLGTQDYSQNNTQNSNLNTE